MTRVRECSLENRSSPVKHGYVSELGLHKQALEEALSCVPEKEEDRAAVHVDELQESLDTILQSISNYAASAGSIQKILASYMHLVVL